MNRFMLVTACLIAVVTAATPAPAQTLAERMAEVRRKGEEAARDSQAKMLQALFYRRITVRFDQTPARDVFAYLQTDLGVPVMGRFSDDRVGHGIDPQTPVTFEAEGMRAIDVLELVLDQCAGVDECTWQLRRSYIEVGTKERLAAQAAQVVRMYPIDDLLYEAPRFEDAPSVGVAGYGYGYGVYGDSGNYPGRAGAGGRSVGGYGPGAGLGGAIQVASGGTAEEKAARARDLLEMILDTVEPNAWRQNGGEWASIHYRDGALVVRAPDFVQRQLGGYPPVAPPKGWEPGKKAAD